MYDSDWSDVSGWSWLRGVLWVVGVVWLLWWLQQPMEIIHDPTAPPLSAEYKEWSQFGG